MTRGGKTKDRSGGTERRCIATGEALPTSQLVRFVIAPDDAIVPDLLEKLPGRGIWVTSRRDALEKAIAKGLFTRAARQKVKVPDDLVALVETGLLRRVCDTLALARKAGQAVAGYEKVRGWLDSGEAAVLLQAADGSERGKTKLSSPPGSGRYIGVLTASELGLAFGRDRVIHGALAAGRLAERVVEDAARLSGLRGDDRKDVGGEGTLGKDIGTT